MPSGDGHLLRNIVGVFPVRFVLREGKSYEIIE